MPRSPKFRKRATMWLGRTALRTFERWMRRKTAIQAEKTGQKIGRFLFRVSRKHRETALSNLSLAFPEKSDAERLEIARKCFEHFGMVATDFLRSSARTDKEVEASIEAEGQEYALAAKEEGHGVLVITAHFGNWERVAQYARVTGNEIYAVARDTDDMETQEEVMRLRESTGLKVISRGNAAKTMISLLREGKFVAVLPDQNCAESFVPFFGKPTGTVLGPATISVRTKSPMVPTFCARVGPGKYKLHIFPRLEPKEGVDGEIMGLTHSMNEAIEKIIRMYPEQWLWLHDRWKSARRKGLL